MKHWQQGKRLLHGTAAAGALGIVFSCWVVLASIIFNTFYMTTGNQKLKIFTWHVHGSYLFYLSQLDIDIYIPLAPEKKTGYWGKGETFPFGDNVKEVPLKDLPAMEFDCILFQSVDNFRTDQFDILTEAQRRLPKIYLEHNAPVSLEAVHPLQNPDVTLVHVTHFNKLMWINQVPRVKVIEHGVRIPEVAYSGEKKRGLVITNHLYQRRWTTGADIFDQIRKKIALDLVGMGTLPYGGLGEILHPGLPTFIAGYRFLFNPIRWTSLGLSVIEAMMCGLPVVSICTTEYASLIRNGENGFISNDLDFLHGKMQLLLHSPDLAREMGQCARQDALKRFSIQRFERQWLDTFYQVISSQNKKLPYYAKNNSLY